MSGRGIYSVYRRTGEAVGESLAEFREMSKDFSPDTEL